MTRAVFGPAARRRTMHCHSRNSGWFSLTSTADLAGNRQKVVFLSCPSNPDPTSLPHSMPERSRRLHGLRSGRPRPDGACHGLHRSLPQSPQAAGVGWYQGFSTHTDDNAEQHPCAFISLGTGEAVGLPSRSALGGDPVLVELTAHPLSKYPRWMSLSPRPYIDAVPVSRRALQGCREDSIPFQSDLVRCEAPEILWNH